MRNTTIEDAADSVSTNVSRWRETARTQPVIYQRQAPFPGGESQGRFAPWQPLTEGDTPDAGPQAACTHGMEDAGEQMAEPLPWLTAPRFWWAYAAVIVALLLGANLWPRG
jgi:hypothetical protein